MSKLLAKLALPKAIGFYVDGNTIHVSQIVAGPLGPIEVGRFSEAAAPGESAALMRDLIDRLVPRRGLSCVPIALGISNEHVYFSSRPVQATATEARAQVLLREALRSSNVSVDDLVVDVVRSQPDKRHLVSLASCDRKYIKQFMEVLKDRPVHLVRAEPAAFALLRRAARQHRAGHNAKIVMRVFLGEDRGLAILVASGVPVVWRQFQLPRGDEATAVISAIRSLTTVGGNCGIESGLDVVMVHGRLDLTRLVDLDWIKQTTGTPLHWVDGPGLDGAQIAHCVARGALREHPAGFDLAKSLKSQRSLWGVFPLREVALQMALLVLFGLFLFLRSQQLEDLRDKMVAENGQHTTALLTEPELKRERQDLLQRVTAVHKFLGTRVSWTEFERDLTDSLPDNVYLTSFHGTNELPSSSKKRSSKTKKSLVLRGAVSIPQDGLIPHEIDHLLDTLRDHELLNRDFPQIELAELKQFKRVSDGNALAMFTVVCLPKNAKKRS